MIKAILEGAALPQILPTEAEIRAADLEKEDAERKRRGQDDAAGFPPQEANEDEDADPVGSPPTDFTQTSNYTDHMDSSQPEFRVVTQPFEFRGWSFLCSAEKVGADAYVPRVTCRSPVEPGPAATQLPVDTDAYSTAEEALRHAEQQAVRWVRDRMGDRKGEA